MSNRILCKFFAHGACLKGEHCEYAHDWTAPANNICTFYQRGNCAYGNRCRYDHVKVSRTQSSGSSSSTVSVGPKVSGSSSISSSAVTISGTAPIASVKAEISPSSRQFLPSSITTWSQQSGTTDTSKDGFGGETRVDGPADQVICSFAAAGHCPRGDKCPHIHGDLCPTCGKHCLHPFRPKEREEHSRACEKMQRHLESLKRSQEIECSVCLERVLSKLKPGERKFGLMSECDHPFCISCIREWRSSSPTSGMDVNSTLRACPICRKLSYFVIPSVIWYFSKDEKEEIIDNYMAKLKSIDCKYFDFGNGSCPFGTSCFYKHAVKPGLCWKRCMNPKMCSKPYIYRRHKGLREQMDDVNDEDLLSEHLATWMLNELEENYANAYDEEDFLTPWESAFMCLQPPYAEDDDDDVPFNVGQMDSVHVLFDYLYRPYQGLKEELELDKLEKKKYCGDYNEEDFLTPWQRSFMWSQLGYDMSDDDD